MLEPNGPLPPEIYWRRRALAIGGAVVVIGLVVWLVVSLTGGGSSDTQSAAASASLAPSAATTYRPDASATGSNQGSGGSGGGGGGGAAANDDASSSGTTTTTTTSSTPVPPGQCPDSSLAVRATPDQPSYPAGQEPGFTVVVTNIGTTACERDLGSGLQQVLVYTLEGRRLWSNTDCFPAGAADLRTLRPGEQAPFTVKWSGTTSEPGCTAPREPVGAGAYSVVGQLGQLRSAPEPFNLT